MTQSGHDPLKLLVVDDETDNLDLLYRTFRQSFEVFRAKSAFDALQILEQEGEMAVIISDQRMPKMKGTEFLSRTVEKYPDTIRIVLTGYTDVEDLVDAINTGQVFKYITKPWRPIDLQVVVQQAVETYKAIKQRTNTLRRALRRESTFNAITKALRESLDYRQILQTITTIFADTFGATESLLIPTEGTEFWLHSDDASQVWCFHSSPVGARPDQSYQSKSIQLGQLDVPIPLAHIRDAIQQQQIKQLQHPADDGAIDSLVVPLTYQQEILAVLILHRSSSVQPWNHEDVELIQSIIEQAALAVSQAKLYHRVQEQTERMQAELGVARQIQTSLLRHNWKSLDQLRIQARCLPAREIGGDFFEVFVSPENDVWLAVGDVSGKGVPAALLMASTISVLRRELAQQPTPDPHLILRTLNQTLMDSLIDSNCLITMVLARYNPQTEKLIYANAGHVYPLVWSRQAVVNGLNCSESQPIKPVCLTQRGIPLGILPEWTASAESYTLSAGDVLLLASDGITEATVTHQPTGKQERPMPGGSSSFPQALLGQQGLWHLILQQQGDPDVDRILNYIQSHNEVQGDDQTILSMEIL
ncbi:MAG: SpoIIE family protein phosphatase [Synechococcales bacterium]|nr:SpoIIE family protein phosphatase [Synechococcales bacterium]